MSDDVIHASPAEMFRSAPDVTIYTGLDLGTMPVGLTMRTAHAAMEAMAESISYTSDRSTGDILIEAVRGLASHPEVVEALHREVGPAIPTCGDGSRHHDFAGHPRCPGCGWDGQATRRAPSQ